MVTERKRAPKKVKPFIFINDEKLIYSSGADLVRGLGAIVLSVLMAKPGSVWNSRELASAISSHPDYNSKQDPARIANFWIYRYKHAGLIKDIK